MHPNGFLKKIEAIDSRFVSIHGIGNLIGTGLDADVYELDDGRTMRIASVLAPGWSDIKSVCDILMSLSNPHVVRVDDVFRVFSTPARVVYATVMEKLEPITDEMEGETLCAIVNSVWKTRPDMSMKIDYNFLPQKKVRQMQRNLRLLPFTYEDIHWGNIMKSACGKYKLIDIDSFQHKIVC